MLIPIPKGGIINLRIIYKLPKGGWMMNAVGLPAIIRSLELPHLARLVPCHVRQLSKSCFGGGGVT